MTRSPIGEIVAIDRGQHHILQAHQLHGLCRVLGLLRIQPAIGVTRIDRAEPAGAGADIAHQHDGCSACTPALTDVGALGLLADRGQTVLVNDAPHRIKFRAALHAHAQPFRLGQSLGITRRRLDAVLDHRHAAVIGKFMAAVDLRRGYAFAAHHIALSVSGCGRAEPH